MTQRVSVRGIKGIVVLVYAGAAEAVPQLMDTHAASFASLYESVLGERVKFDGPTEKSREGELAKRGIRLVGYAQVAAGQYEFRRRSAGVGVTANVLDGHRERPSSSCATRRDAARPASAARRTSV